MSRWMYAVHDHTRNEWVFCFAVSQGAGRAALWLAFALDGASSMPKLNVVSGSCRAEIGSPFKSASGTFEVCVIVELPDRPADDDQLEFVVSDTNSGGLPTCRILLRRTGCRINSALVERSKIGVPLRDSMQAALLWYGWRRFREIVGLKRFTSGKSGSDVVVLRPRLRDPQTGIKDFVPGIIDGAWGSCLVAKTGQTAKVREEWERFHDFIRDRMHPFMSRSEEMLTIQLAIPLDPGQMPVPRQLAANDHVADPDQATVIGSFLGGGLVEPDSFQQIVSGTSDVTRCIAVLDKLFAVMGTWYSGGVVRKLRDWKKRVAFDQSGKFLLSGKYDLSVEDRPAGVSFPLSRIDYRDPLAWDIPFIQEKHLHHHLLGSADQRDGLIYRILDFDVRFSLTHGDLHPLNILADSNDVWLLDFGESGVSPTLFDFAKLEVYLRLWCLDLQSSTGDLEDAAFQFESQLLDHLIGSEGSLEPVCRLAPALGTSPDELLKIARCLASVRRQATRYTLGSPDCRDYLAVLYLTVLDALRFAGSSPELTENFRLVVTLAWVLEDVLSRIVGLEPYPRNRLPMDARHLVSSEWIDQPGLPGRVAYFIRSAGHPKVLPSVAATRGVMQNANHHLDVFDHSLLVMAYVEQLLEDPVAGLTDPASLDLRVRENLLAQGVSLPDLEARQRVTSPPDATAVAPHLDAIRSRLQTSLDPQSRLVLKAASLFHDVGKPATRSLNVQGKAGRKVVQFLGHEVLGMQMVQDELRTIFPDDAANQEQCSRLIRAHHEHHTLVNQYRETDERRKLLQAVIKRAELKLPSVDPKSTDKAARMIQKEADYLSEYFTATASPWSAEFPLLILHGYADSLACRGPATAWSMSQVAEIDLELLALWALVSS